jgi:hypothetical protein
VGSSHQHTAREGPKVGAGCAEAAVPEEACGRGAELGARAHSQACAAEWLALGFAS